MLAMGKTWDEQREIYARHPRLLEIIDHLEANYETDAWYSVR